MNNKVVKKDVVREKSSCVFGSKNPMDKRTPAEFAFDILNHIFMFALAAITLYPLWHVVMASFSDPDLLMGHSGFLLKPLDFTTEGYSAIMDYPFILNGFKNTLIVVVVSLVLQMTLTCFGAYFMSRKGIVLRKAFMIFVTITMYFSGGVIPLYLVVTGLGLRDSLWALIIPNALNSFNMIMMRSAFDNVPESLIEAAEIEGANDFTILFRIVVPVCMSTVAVVALYYVVTMWNAWYGASIFLNDTKKFPLQLVLRDILSANDSSGVAQGIARGEGSAATSVNAYKIIEYSTIVIATVPMLVIYPFLQKYFTKGVMIGAVKG